MGQSIACSPACCTTEKGFDDSGIIRSSKAESQIQCLCGNRFLPDSLFCRRCGRKRPNEADFAADVRLVAWMRRRNGPDCDFGEVFEELFGGRDPVGPRRWEEVLVDHGYRYDAKGGFALIDRHAKCGMIGASDLELFQIEIEDREAEGLKHLRTFLKTSFGSPIEAYKELGKGEGDVLTEVEFAEALKRLGFKDEDPLKLFHFMDKDYSGEICFAEFKAVMRAAGASKKKESRYVEQHKSNGAQGDSRRDNVQPKVSPRKSEAKNRRRAESQ